jgi:hypothetical protein
MDIENVPVNWKEPDFTKISKAHDWLNYVSEPLQVMWPTLSDLQKQVIASALNDASDIECWY